MNLIEKAKEAGRKAYEDGRPGAPVLDETYMELTKGCKVGESLSITRAWIDGWTIANLNDEFDWAVNKRNG